ncbi:MAG: hypothetical protein IT557_00320 [Alphaproteobacteria bacterium]|nr:hypothetical protein [Alphaproteobacteria bacterium]
MLAILAGCAMVAPFDDAALARVRRGEETAVMLRFVLTDQNGAKVDLFAHSLGEDNFNIALGDFDSGGAPERRQLTRFPTEAAREDGLVYLFLRPGYHYLAIQGARRTDAFSYEARFRAAPRWRIEVPAGVPVLYAGSFMLRGQSEKLIFGDVVVTAIDQGAATVAEEGAFARTAAARDLPGLPPPLFRPAVAHKGPVLLGTPAR